MFSNHISVRHGALNLRYKDTLSIRKNYYINKESFYIIHTFTTFLGDSFRAFI